MSHPLHILDNDASDQSGCVCQDEARLRSEGWERRYLADPRAAREAEENYTALGYEVLLVAPDPESLREECSGCKVVMEQYRVVFTRRQRASS